MIIVCSTTGSGVTTAADRGCPDNGAARTAAERPAAKRASLPESLLLLESLEGVRGLWPVEPVRLAFQEAHGLQLDLELEDFVVADRSK